MNTIEAPVQALGWALLHFLWQGALVGALAAGVLALLRDARPQARYAVACLALLACLLLPVATMLRGTFAMDPAPQVATALGVDVGTATAAAASTSSPETPDPSAMRALLAPQLPTVVVLWSIGAALLALRMALGLAWVARVGGAGRGRPHHYWQAQLDVLGARMKLSRRVLLRIVDGIDTPVVARALRPVVLVPATLLRMPPELLEALLAHELAHVRRHDYLVGLLQGAVEALLFYHPVTWWLSRTVRRERELIADDLAAAALGDRRRVARALEALSALQARAETPFPAIPNPVLAADGGQLVSRIQHLVRPRRPSVHWKAAFPVIGISLLCLSFAQATVAVDAGPATGERSVVDQALAAPASTFVTVDGDDVEVDRPEDDGEDGWRTQGTLRIGGDDPDRDSYALLDADDADGLTYIDGSLDDLEKLRAMRTRIDGGFLWVRRDGKEFVGSDPRLLATIRAAWAATEPVSQEMEALGQQMEKHGQVMEKIGQRMEAQASTSQPEAEAMERLGKRMSEIAARQADLAAKSARLAHDASYADDEAARERAEAAMEALDADMEKVEAEMDALSDRMEAHGEAIERAHAPLEALGEEMERASAPMEALGEQMEVLGKQMERLSERADAQTRSAIDAALRDGTLVPVDRQASR
jgi:beta-lactamase regulating signal transducer with metallopeptidase domain